MTGIMCLFFFLIFFFQAEDGIRYLVRSRGLGDVYKRQIYTIADNARYYKNKDLKEWIKDTKIIQVFLPPYSPNLNIIERLWKFLKKKVINSNFFRTKHEFRDAVHTFFENVSKYKNKLASLLTLNFLI